MCVVVDKKESPTSGADAPTPRHWFSGDWLSIVLSQRALASQRLVLMLHAREVRLTALVTVVLCAFIWFMLVLAPPHHHAVLNDDARFVSNVSLMLSRFASVHGEHPLCDAATLRAEMASLSRSEPPPQMFNRGGATAAAMSVIGIVPPSNILNHLRALFNSRPAGWAIVEEFVTTFPPLDEFFLAPAQVDYVLLYSADTGLDCMVIAAAERLKWRRTSLSGGEAEATRGSDWCRFGFSFGSSASGDYLSPRGTRVKVRARYFALPRYLQRDPSLLENINWRKCASSGPEVERQWPLGYVLYSGAVFAHHLLIDPLLAQYDFTFKVDTDIRFFRAPPEDFILQMRRRGCAIAHTQIYPGSYSSGCQHGAFEALQRFATLADSPSASAAHSWCSAPSGIDYFFGNLMGGASAFLRSEANTLLNVWLYECHDGYFHYRWGDQASPALYMCHWIDAPYLNASNAVCDFSHWRHSGVFEHFR